MYTVKKRPGGNDPFEHPEVCGVTLLSSSSNQRRAHETSEWSFILLILDHAEQISDFSLHETVGGSKTGDGGISVCSFMSVILIWTSLKDFLTIAMKSVAFCLEPIYREILLGND